jgi:hypothetical protein
MQKPSIGRIVHLCLSRQRIPAVITYVHSDTCVNVTRLDLGNAVNSCTHEEESPESAAQPNTMATKDSSWSWPPRV